MATPFPMKHLFVKLGLPGNLENSQQADVVLGQPYVNIYSKFV